MSESNAISTRANGGDEHGVRDLLREVSQRSISLSAEDRKEVSAMVKRVEEVAERKTPNGKLRKKIAENTSTSPTNDTAQAGNEDSGNSTNNTGIGWGKDFFQKFQSPSAASTNKLQQNGKDFFQKFSLMSPAQQSPSAASTNKQQENGKDFFQKFSLMSPTQQSPSADSTNKQQHNGKDFFQKFSLMSPPQQSPSADSTNKHQQNGKDFFQKFSLMSPTQQQSPSAANANQQQQNDQRTSKPDFFQKFSINIIPNSSREPQEAATNGEKEEPSEFRKAFERSTQSGRDFMQNVSANFKSSLSLSQPTSSETATAVSNSLRANAEVKASRNAAARKGRTSVNAKGGRKMMAAMESAKRNRKMLHRKVAQPK